jgi:hypothetical protein
LLPTATGRYRATQPGRIGVPNCRRDCDEKSTFATNRFLQFK